MTYHNSSRGVNKLIQKHLFIILAGSTPSPNDPVALSTTWAAKVWTPVASAVATCGCQAFHRLCGEIGKTLGQDLDILPFESERLGKKKDHNQEGMMNFPCFVESASMAFWRKRSL